MTRAHISAIVLLLCSAACSDGTTEDPLGTRGSLNDQDPSLETNDGTPRTGELATAGGGGSAESNQSSGGDTGLGSGGAQSGGSATGGSLAATGGSAGGDGSGGSASASGGNSGACVWHSPPGDFAETIDATWQEMTGQLADRGAGARPASASVLAFDNTILDQLVETNGTLNYCVRWESNAVLGAANRDQLEAALERNINEWLDAIDGYGCFPFSKVDVKVVGWASMGRNTFDWDDDEHPGLMYIGDDSFENAPQCAQECGRFFHREAGYQYPDCEGGRDNHYDMSLWLTEGFAGGAGGDWGQRMGRSYFENSLNQPTLVILSHEIGHGFGFPDYYNWSTWVPGVAAPPSIMVAGAQFEVTDWDTWMMRRLWNELKAARSW